MLTCVICFGGEGCKSLCCIFSVILSRALLPCAVPCRQVAERNVVLSVRGPSVLSIKRCELRLGTTSLSPSFLSLMFLCLTEVRLFILPQTVGVLGVDVKVPAACGVKGYACLCSGCMRLSVQMNARVHVS